MIVCTCCHVTSKETSDLFEFWHLRSLVTDQTPLSRHHINSEQKESAVSRGFYSIILRKWMTDGHLQGGSLTTVDIVESRIYTAQSSVMTRGFEAWQ